MKDLDISEFIRQRRIKLGLTQRDISDFLELENAQYISNVERGLCNFSLRKAKSLAVILKVSEKSIVDSIIRRNISDLRTRVKNQ